MVFSLIEIEWTDEERPMLKKQVAYPRPRARKEPALFWPATVLLVFFFFGFVVLKNNAVPFDARDGSGSHGFLDPKPGDSAAFGDGRRVAKRGGNTVQTVTKVNEGDGETHPPESEQGVLEEVEQHAPPRRTSSFSVENFVDGVHASNF